MCCRSAWSGTVHLHDVITVRPGQHGNGVAHCTPIARRAAGVDDGAARLGQAQVAAVGFGDLPAVGLGVADQRPQALAIAPAGGDYLADHAVTSSGKPRRDSASMEAGLSQRHSVRVAPPRPALIRAEVLFIVQPSRHSRYRSLGYPLSTT